MLSPGSVSGPAPPSGWFCCCLTQFRRHTGPRNFKRIPQCKRNQTRFCSGRLSLLKHSSERQLFTTPRSRTTITELLLSIFLQKEQNQQSSEAPPSGGKIKKNGRNAETSQHDGATNWSNDLIWVAVAGSWCERIAAIRLPGWLLKTAPPSSRTSLLNTKPNVFCSSSGLVCQQLLPSWSNWEAFLCRNHSSGRNDPNLSKFTESVRFIQDLQGSNGQMKKSSLSDKCNQRRGN